MSPRSRIAGVLASTAMLVVSLLGAASPASAADLIGAQLCVASNVPEPATLTWNYPEGHPSHWFDGRTNPPSCAIGSAVKDRVSLEARVRFDGPNIHQTWEVLFDPARVGGDVLFEMTGPGGVGGIEALMPGDHYSVTANGVTATVTWVSTHAGRPHLRFALTPAA